MPRKQSTAAQRARQRQADTGEKYTAALRAETQPTVTHRMFSAAGAGWAPIIERAEQRLREVWPDHPKPHWEEKFGDLVWKSVPYEQDPKVWPVIGRAARNVMEYKIRTATDTEPPFPPASGGVFSGTGLPCNSLFGRLLLQSEGFAKLEHHQLHSCA